MEITALFLEAKPRTNIKEIKLDLESEAFLQKCHELIETSTIDIVKRTIAGKDYRIVVDDMGRLRENPKITYDGRATGEGILVGNIIIVGAEKPGGEEVTSLSKADIKRVQRDLFWNINHTNAKIYLQIITKEGKK